MVKLLQNALQALEAIQQLLSPDLTLSPAESNKRDNLLDLKARALVATAKVMQDKVDEAKTLVNNELRLLEQVLRDLDNLGSMQHNLRQAAQRETASDYASIVNITHANLVARMGSLTTSLTRFKKESKGIDKLPELIGL